MSERNAPRLAVFGEYDLSEAEESRVQGWRSDEKVKDWNWFAAAETSSATSASRMRTWSK
jgi:hypothetical protein